MFAGELLLCIIHPPGLYLLGIIRKAITQRAAGFLGSTNSAENSLCPRAPASLGVVGFPIPFPAP